MRNYILTIFISTYNRANYIDRFIKNVDLSRHLIQLIIVDDNSTDLYSVPKNEDITYIKSDKTQHKFVGSYLNKSLIRGTFTTFLDDKDYFINSGDRILVEFLKTINNDELAICDMYNNGEIIGHSFQGLTLHEFTYMKAKYGDKLLIFPTKYFMDFNFNLSEFKSETVYNHDFFVLTLIHIRVNYLKGIIINHEYLENGITKNNKKYKIANFLTHKYIIEHQSNEKASLKFMIYKSYEA